MNYLNINYKNQSYVLTKKESKNFSIYYEHERFRIGINKDFSGVFNNKLQIFIERSVNRIDDYSGEKVHSIKISFSCECYMEGKNLYCLSAYNNINGKKVRKDVIYNTVYSVLNELSTQIYTELQEELKKKEIEAINDIHELERFIWRKCKSNEKVEYSVNDTLKFGIGENCYTSPEIAGQAKEDQPIITLRCGDITIISQDTIIFFLYWLRDKDNHLSISDGEDIRLLYKKPNN